MYIGCKKLIYYAFPIFFSCYISFSKADVIRPDEETWKWVQRCLLQAFNHLAEDGLKKWDLSVTPEGFFRFRKVLPTGKQEYYSFHFNRLKQVSFSESPKSKIIVFETLSDDIIVQTFNDPKGNIDSMSTHLFVPVMDTGMISLDSLRTALSMFKH